VKPLQARHAAIEEELTQLLARWEELEAKRGAGRIRRADLNAPLW